MKQFFSLIGACLMATTMLAGVVNYTADDVTIFKNPERGFTEELSRKVTAAKPNVVKGQISANYGASEKRTLIMVLYNLYNFKAQDIPEEVLSGFDEDMAELRKCGFKCVLRFAYTETESDKVDATPEWVERHLEQLQPHLEANKDVIYVVEAGFVGVWGEWYYTSNYGNEQQHLNNKRRRVVDALLSRVPVERFVLFRYPMIKTDYFGDADPLSAEEAFTGTNRARMGCHNDAFLNNWGNDGTYASDDKSDDPAVRQYIADETLYVPNGGETNVESDSRAQQVYTQAESEMRTYHWSFCGRSYATQVTSRWRSDGIFDELNRVMGYRFQLVTATIPDEAETGFGMPVTMQIKNVGCAPLYNERKAYFVFKNEQSEVRIQLLDDPRRWLPNHEVTTINAFVVLPTDMPSGTYQTYLYMPDSSPSIADDPRYAVRFANEEVWDEVTGMNDLKASVVVVNNGRQGLTTNDQLPTTNTKILRDGQLLIQRGEKTYTAQGIIVEK